MSSTRFVDPDALPRERRALAVGPAEVHPFTTADGVELRLTRFRGGAKGPVVLSHGLGVSSAIFTTDTIGENLVEHLFGAGYDVWLLDYRSSIELPASQTSYDADQIARFDYPAAVSEVRAATGVDSVQMVVHCFGSTTFFMAMLSGLEGVRSAVASQVAMHLLASPLTRLKSGLHVPGTLSRLGVQSMTAYADSDEGWLERLYDRALAHYPLEADEHCDSAVCHRVSFLYGLLYEHDQLARQTHDALHELFGIASMHALDHLSRMVRQGHVVAADGTDSYLPHLDRLAIPIRFVHGENNACFLPRSTELSLELLSEHNDPGLYSRRIIPGYGHIDCIFGEHAARDVYPLVLEHLEETH
jgi:cholesterol oxidase